jgi:hypothetical protein
MILPAICGFEMRGETCQTFLLIPRAENEHEEKFASIFRRSMRGQTFHRSLLILKAGNLMRAICFLLEDMKSPHEGRHATLHHTF